MADDDDDDEEDGGKQRIGLFEDAISLEQVRRACWPVCRWR